VCVFIAVARSQARGAMSPLTTVPRRRRRGLSVGQTAGRARCLRGACPRDFQAVQERESERIQA